jgi:lysine 2,3-aminomutase
MRNYQDIPLWKEITPEEWTNWHWQMQNIVTTLDRLEKVINLSVRERRGVEQATKHLKMRITPHIISLMDQDNPTDPLRLQFIPSDKELESINDDDLFGDVNADDQYSPVKGLVHRYPSKVLILPTNYCGSYCRYCFRRKLIRETEESLNREQLDGAFDYIRRTPAVEEVIFSGGDPLVLSDNGIEYLLNSLSKIPNVQIIRFHTRLPVTNPYRITKELLKVLKRYKKRFPIYFVIHTDSTLEFSKPMKEAVTNLVNNGFPCMASCPLLKGVNDNEEALRSLWTELVKLRVKPYYLFHSDPVKGLRHFLVPIDRGLEIVQNLYDRMSGLAMPQYCFNAPGGGGHVLLCPSYVTKIADKRYLIKTFDGQQFEYNDNFEE